MALANPTLAGNGIPVNFGFKSSGTDYGLVQALAGNPAGGVLTGYLLQSSDTETGADVESVRALQGDIQAKNWYDIHQKASLRFVISGTTGIGTAGHIATAIANTTLAAFTPGVIINITACASSPDLVNTYWEIQAGVKIAGDITKSAEITLPLEYRPGITASQPA